MSLTSDLLVGTTVALIGVIILITFNATFALIYGLASGLPLTAYVLARRLEPTPVGV